eukprot:7407710-Prorocentrum_lima.AAC.1
MAILHKASVHPDVVALLKGWHGYSWLEGHGDPELLRTRNGIKQGCVLGGAMLSLFNAGILECVGTWLDGKAWT